MTTIDHETEVERLTRENRETLAALAASIDELINGEERAQRIGFLLLVFPLNDSGQCDFVTNAAEYRAALGDMLRQIADRLADGLELMITRLALALIVLVLIVTLIASCSSMSTRHDPGGVKAIDLCIAAKRSDCR